jgi:peptide methionine sulfoxide reductase MsrA
LAGRADFGGATAFGGAGCFWGVEVAFRRVPGVIDAAVGHAGGMVADASYEQVRTGRHRRPIVTEIVPFSDFYPAEEYHQRYLEKGGLATCALP